MRHIMDNKEIKILSKSEYEAQIAATRDRRMSWWRDARFGMFVHYGLYSIRGMQEWSMVRENTPIEEYEKLANQFLKDKKDRLEIIKSISGIQGLLVDIAM